MQVLLGISGGIAAYKAPEVVRALRRKGHEVRCAVTENGARLVAPAALAAVSGNPVSLTLWPGDGKVFKMAVRYSTLEQVHSASLGC